MGDNEAKTGDGTLELSASSKKAQSPRTVIAVMTDDKVDREDFSDREILNDARQKLRLQYDERITDEIAIPQSVIQEAMAQIVLMKKESDEEVIEVDVELEGEDPPPEFFISEDSQIDEAVQRQILAAFPQNMEVGNEDENAEGVDVICGKCGKHFNDIDALQWHLKLHARIKNIIAETTKNRYSKNKLLYQCPECEITFSKSSELTKHMDSFHANRQLDNVTVKSEIDKDNNSFIADGVTNSEFCDDIFSRVDTLQKHVENEPMELNVQPVVNESENCGQNFAAMNILQQHVKNGSCSSENAEKSQPKQTVVVSLKDILHNTTTCPHCMQTFTSIESLKTHMQLEHDAQNFEESMDDEDDFGLLEVTDPIDEKPLIIQIIKESNSCKTCNQTFSDFAELQRHELTHAQDKTYNCNECDEEFTTYFSLLRHSRIHHVNLNGEAGILICKKCGRSFTNEEDLEDHIEDHTDNAKRKKYQCSVCQKTFTHKHSLKNHMPLHNGMGKHKCPECNKLFPCASSLNRHIKIHDSSEKQFVCEECDKAFKDAYGLKKHLRIHSSDRPYVCQECGASFRTQSTLSAHTVVHTKIKPFPCEECGKKFSFRSDLNRHMKLHSGVRPYQCDMCPKAFYEKSRLVIHKRIHTGEKPFACLECDETFISSRNLARHMKNHNPTFICTVCNKTYVDAYTLKIHMYKHTGERPHACSHCTKRFRTPALLKKHELTHTGVKPFICESCGRGFTSALNLKNHTTLHTGERPFQCLQCNKCFPTESTLKVHMQFHGEKEYFCEQCGKGFHRVYELKLHAITHAPQKPFSCELCNKSFCHKATYKAHMNTHTGATKYPCPHCNKTFLRSNTLRKHMKTHAKAQARAAGAPTGFAQPEYYEESYLCTKCGCTFPDIDVLRKHLAEDHDAMGSKEETDFVVEEVPTPQPGEVQV